MSPTDEYGRILDELERLHAVKSGGYGTGDDPYGNFTAVGRLTGQPRYLYAVHRAIEKLTRVLSLHEQGRVGELAEEFLDVASGMVCAEAMRRLDEGQRREDILRRTNEAYARERVFMFPHEDFA